MGDSVRHSPYNKGNTTNLLVHPSRFDLLHIQVHVDPAILKHGKNQAQSFCFPLDTFLNITSKRHIRDVCGVTSITTVDCPW